MKEQPLVSICIPIYNDEEFVGEALDSLVNQTYKNLEIIFSNNCCTDRSIDIIKSYNDPRIKIFSNEKNMGGRYNFEKVFTYATGKYMTYLGADDKVALDAYEKCVAVLEANNDIVLVNTWIEIINNRSEHVFTKRYWLGSGRISNYWAIRSNFLYGTNFLGEPNGSLWRRSAFERTRRPPDYNGTDWTSDLDIKLELLLLGNTYMIPEPLGKFRISDDSGSNANFRFLTAKMFRQYAYNIYKDKRYNLSFFWVIAAAISSFIMQYLRILFYVLFIKKKSDN